MRNPWDLSRTPGGSSGGSAAAVAAGLVPIAHGNDGGGSIRIPAACCGLVGLKPSRGRISRGPDLGDSYLGADGVLSRTVAETALLLDVMAGYEPGDANWAPRPAEPFTATMRRPRGSCGSRCRWATRSASTATPTSCTASTRPRRCCATSGTRSRRRAPRCRRRWPTSSSRPSPARRARDRLRRAPRRPGAGRGRDRPLSRHIRDVALELPSTGYLAAVAQLQFLARGIVAFFADYDLLLTPVLAKRPLPIGELDGCGEDPAADLLRAGAFAPFTPLFNVTGQPAISIPIGFGDDGLPTAVQLVGHPLADDTLLQIAAQIESARPWAGRTPPL